MIIHVKARNFHIWNQNRNPHNSIKNINVALPAETKFLFRNFNNYEDILTRFLLRQLCFLWNLMTSGAYSLPSKFLFWSVYLNVVWIFFWQEKLICDSGFLSKNCIDAFYQPWMFISLISLQHSVYILVMLCKQIISYFSIFE